MLNKLIKKTLNTLPRETLMSLGYLMTPLLDLVFRGHNFIDPINGKTYSKFLPYGYDKLRENALSPGTLSLERHRLLWLFLKNETDIFDKKIKLLHIAPEHCLYRVFSKSKNIDYTTVDLSSPLAKIKANIINLPFDDNTFDVVLCNHVLEHVEEDLIAIKELYRVLKPGAWGVLQVPLNLNIPTYENKEITQAEDRKVHFGQYDHVRIYGNDYCQRLNEHGFKSELINLNSKLNAYEIKRYSIDPNEPIPYITKPIID